MQAETRPDQLAAEMWTARNHGKYRVRYAYVEPELPLHDFGRSIDALHRLTDQAKIRRLF
jgi:hypothetical protein